MIDMINSHNWQLIRLLLAWSSVNLCEISFASSKSLFQMVHHTCKSHILSDPCTSYKVFRWQFVWVALPSANVSQNEILFTFLYISSIRSLHFHSLLDTYVSANRIPFQAALTLLLFDASSDGSHMNFTDPRGLFLQDFTFVLHPFDLQYIVFLLPLWTFSVWYFGLIWIFHSSLPYSLLGHCDIFSTGLPSFLILIGYFIPHHGILMDF
jgi:hypothetical protein